MTAMQTNKTPDLSTYFAAFRDNLEAGLDKAFNSMRNVSVEGRLTALHAWFDSDSEQKVLGVIPIGGAMLHSHEHRLLFSVPALDLGALDAWWDYAKGLQHTLVRADPLHQFSIISLILVCGSCEGAALRRLRRLSSDVNYRPPATGWSTVRMAVVDASTGKVSTNRAGAPLAAILRQAQP